MKALTNYLMGVVTAIALLLAGGVWATDTFVGGQPYLDLGTLVDAGTLDSNQSFEITGDKLAGYSTAVFYMDHGNTAATDISLTCSGSDDGGTTKFPLQSAAVSAGVGTLTDASFLKAVTGDDEWIVRVDVSGLHNYLYCVTSDTSGAGSDTLTITGYLSAK